MTRTTLNKCAVSHMSSNVYLPPPPVTTFNYWAVNIALQMESKYIFNDDHRQFFQVGAKISLAQTTLIEDIYEEGELSSSQNILF